MNDNDIVPLSLIQVSPLILKNCDEANTTKKEHYKDNESLSSPLVKLNLYSMSIKVMWDDHDDNDYGERKCNDQNNLKSNNSAEIQMNESKEDIRRKFQACQGTLYINSNDENKYSKKDIIDRIRMQLVRKKIKMREKSGQEDPHIDRLEQGMNPMVLPMMILPSQDPSNSNGIPCLIRVFSGCNQRGIPHYNPAKHSKENPAHIMDGTLVQILPPIISTAIDRKLQLCCVEIKTKIPTFPKQILKLNHNISLKDSLSGISELNYGQKEVINDTHVLSRFEPETKRSLVLRMKALLSHHILVGTTNDAMHNRKQDNQRRERLCNTTAKYWGSCETKKADEKESRHDKRNPKQHDFGRDGALTVHDPIHGSGKTSLVIAIARSVLKCQAVHVLNGSSLFAKFGASGADTALETMLHQIIVSAAVKGNTAGGVGSICIILDHLDTFVPSILSGTGGKGDPSLPALNANGAYLTKVIHSIKANKYFPAPAKNPFYNIKEKSGFLFPVKVCIVGIVTCDDDGGRKASKVGSNFRSVLDVLGANRYRLPNRIISSDNNVKGQNLSSKKQLFQTIGGNYDAKRALEDVLAIDKKKRHMLSKFGLSLPTGVLLYGPPGTGKTLLAKATSQVMIQLAGGSGGNTEGMFISLKASDIVCSEVGKSEKLLSSTFETARKRSPSVIFIDEFQALFTSRDKEDGTGGKGSGRLASTLLTLMDDVTKWRDANLSVDHVTSSQIVEKNRVVVLAATNTPWMVDRAFLRAGRFDRVVHVGLPTCPEREAILKVHVDQMKMDPSTSVDEICKQMAKECIGFSGADLSNIVRAAAIRCMLASQSQVTMQHFIEAKKHDVIHPSSDQNLVNRLLQWRP